MAHMLSPRLEWRPSSCPAAVPHMFQRKETLAIPIWLPLLLIAGYLFFGLGSYGLLDNNEGLYTEIAREMSRGSSLVIPHVNGLLYMEKPPLLYYLVAACLSLFGETEAAARAVPLAASLVCMAGVWWFAARLRRPEAGKLAVMILASSLGFMLMARVVMFDMLLTAFLTLALFCFNVAWREGNRRVLRVAWACLALALLTKGFLALVLFGLVLGVHFLLNERRGIWKALGFLADGPGLLLFLAIALPWHVLASMEHADFAWSYFINEHVLRFLGKRIPHDYYSGPVWYYLPRLLGFLFPWSFFLPLAFVRSGRSGDPRGTGFLWAAWLVPLAFFSLSSAKANYYMVVALPALALLLALHLESLVSAGRTRLLMWPAGLMLILALAGGGFLFLKPTLLAGRTALQFAMAGLFPALCGLSLWAAWFRRPVVALAAAALLLAPVQVCLFQELAQQEASVSGRPLARLILARCPGCEVMIYKDFENISALPFYLPQPLSIIDSVSNDLWFAQQEAIKAGKADFRFVSTANLAAHLGGRRLALVVLQDHLAEFRGSALAGRFHAVSTVGRATLFLNTMEVAQATHGTSLALRERD